MFKQQSFFEDMAPEPPLEPPAPAPLFELPLNTGKKYPITAAQVAKWAKEYPAVDIMHELKAMREWIYGERRRVMTKRGIGGFIAHWLGKHQNEGGTRTYIGKKKATPQAARRPETSYDLGEIDKMLDKITF